jgi:low temperature requirement protein LtrA
MEVRGGRGRDVSTLELFFDLVYVYAITQVVGLIHDDATLAGLAKGALVLWLLWWAWAIYTWTTNWTGTDGIVVRLFLLTAMGATLLMALAIPDAFGASSIWFGVMYFIVRILASVFYWVESADYPDQRQAFNTFFPMAFLAAALVLVGGFLDQPWLTILWIVAAALDALAAFNAGKGTWAVDTHHFAERNGLFVIVALGETIVGIGLTAAGVERDAIHIAAIIVGFVIAASLWWAYFDRAAPLIDSVFDRATGKGPGRIARDAYSLLHYPLIVGIVFYAVAAEEIVAHPDEPLGTVGRLALSLGVALVLVSIAASLYRVTSKVATARILAAVAVMAIGAIAGSWNAVVFAAAVAAATVMALTFEHLRPWTYAVDEESSDH